MVTSLPDLHDARLADGQHEIVDLGHREGAAIDDLVFQEDHRIGIADRGLEQALGVGGGIRRDHFHAGHRGIPGGIILAVLGADAGGGAVGAAEHDGAAHLAARHVAGLGGGIDDLVHRLHGEIPGHEFHDGLEAVERRADAQAGKAMLGDRRVDHAAVAEFLQQALAKSCRRPDIGRLPRPSGTPARRGAFLRPWRRASASRTVMVTISVPAGSSGSPRSREWLRRRVMAALSAAVFAAVGLQASAWSARLRLSSARRRRPKHPRRRPEAWRWAR